MNEDPWDGNGGGVRIVFAAAATAQTTLRMFTGGQQRPDVMRKVADEYQKKNPNVKIEIEVGGATSEAQQQYLNTVLVAKDSALDLMLIDVIRPAEVSDAIRSNMNAYLSGTKTTDTALGDMTNRLAPIYR